MDSFQLFVGVFDTCLVWYLLVLPSETHAAANMTSLRAIDGDTIYHSCDSFSLANKSKADPKFTIREEKYIHESITVGGERS